MANTGFSLADHQDAAKAIGECLQDLNALLGHINRAYAYPPARMHGVRNAIKRTRKDLETMRQLLQQEMRESYPYAHNETIHNG